MGEQFPIYDVAMKVAGYLPAAVLRWRYPESRLADLVYFDFLPRSESAWINLGQAPAVRLSLQLINLSPFEVELDRANLRFSVGGATITLAELNRRAIGPGKTLQLFLEAPLSDGHANLLARDAPDVRAWLDGRIDFNCKIRPFAKQLASLQDVQVKLVNAHLRRG